MRIVFMGTPEFAVPTLAKVAAAGHEVVGVVTAPDRPAGRGRQLKASAVKEFAVEKGWKVLQPEKLKSPEFVAELTELKPDLAVVVAFRMLPEVVWSLPRLGTLNLHASLLPDYRGAAPINWVIINGETQTGITTFFIDHQIDTGDLLMQETVNIEPHWVAGDLHDVLMEKGGDLVVRTLEALEAGTLAPIPQDPALFRHHAPKLTKELPRIDWKKPAEQVVNLVRGLSPFPGAYTTLEGKMFKVLNARLGEDSEVPAGTLRRSAKPPVLEIAAGDRWVILETVQAEGKSRMPVADYLRGNPVLPDIADL